MLPGPTELALILVIILIVFGAGKLPQVMRSLGEGVKMFREAQNKEGEAGGVEVGPTKELSTKAVVGDAIEVDPKASTRG